MVLVVREFFGTRDPLIRDPLIRDPLNTNTLVYCSIKHQQMTKYISKIQFKVVFLPDYLTTVARIEHHFMPQ